MIRRWSVAIFMLAGAAFAAVLCSCTPTSDKRRDSSLKDENDRKGLASFTQMRPLAASTGPIETAKRPITSPYWNHSAVGSP